MRTARAGLLCCLLAAPLAAAEPALADFQHLVRTETWIESWPDASGAMERREVTAEVWTAAMQAMLDQHHVLRIPARDRPYYLDGPLVLKSGDRLQAGATAELRLKPGTNTCMVRNAGILDGSRGPVPGNTTPDEDIHIEGGIWTTLSTAARESNGNARGASSKVQPVPGTHGVILLHHARRVSVRNLTVRQSRAFAVHLGNVREFHVEGIRLDRHWRDGVHVNGPASEGVIRDVHGVSHDDTVSIAAWDWRGYAPSFGPISRLVIERVSGVPASTPSADAIRLLPGVKRFEDGTLLDCPIQEVVLRDITDIREFKCYDQPNLETGRDQDFSHALGKLRGITLERLAFTRPGVIQIAAEVDGFQMDGVDLKFTPEPGFKLVQIGPMSQTYRHGPDPAQWVEIFSPDRDVTVRGFQLRNVRVNGTEVPDAGARFLQVKDQQLNPRYPATTPRGGTGKARLIP